MRTVNKVTLLGNVGMDPEIRSSSMGTVIAKFSLATSYQAKDREKETEWHNLVVFGRMAEIVRDYVHKGDKLYVEGRLKTETWDKDGEKRYRTIVIANELSMLGDRSDVKAETGSETKSETVDDGDIPF